jgi:hypothetical protein
MMNADCVVVDANIAFKALVAGRGDLRDRLGPAAARAWRNNSDAPLYFLCIQYRADSMIQGGTLDTFAPFLTSATVGARLTLDGTVDVFSGGRLILGLGGGSVALHGRLI